MTERVQEKLPEHLQGFYEQLSVGDLPDHERAYRNVEDILSAADGLAQARISLQGLGPRDAAFLAHEVRKAIWSELIRKPELKSLIPLQNVCRSLGHLVIASLNNDLVIEAFCQRFGLRLERGFGNDDRFDAERLDSDRADVVLLKLHGSVDWASSWASGLLQFRGRFHRADGSKPLRSPVPDLTLVFPSRNKTLDVLALRELFAAFSNRLQEARVLVVVGCQMGDHHVVETVAEGCRRNPDLRILVVDPSPLSVIERFRRYRQYYPPKDRFDVLPLPFEEALAGRLVRRIEDCATGRRSLGYRLTRLLEAYAESEELSESFRRLRQTLETEDITAHEIEEAEKLLRQRLPETPVTGPATDLLQEVCAMLRSPRSEAGAALVGLLERASRREPPVGNGVLTRDKGEIYVHRPGRLVLLRPDGRGGKVTPAPEQTTGAVFFEDREPLFLCHRLLRREGAGLLKRGSGLLGWQFIRRQQGSRSLGAAAVLGSEVRRGEVPDKQALRAAFVTGGGLSWPTALGRLSDSEFVLVESRRASLVQWPSGRVVQATKASYLNLVDCVCDPERRLAYLLEGGVEGEGQLLVWDLEAESEPRALVEPLLNAEGIDLEPAGERLIVSLEGAGQILAVPLAPDGELAATPIPLVRGLLNPRWLAATGRGEGWVATGLGLLWWESDR